MESPAISHKFRSTEAGYPYIDAPYEWTPALMELQVDPSQWLDTRVKLQGVELEVYQRKGPDGDPIVVAEWPRSGPGFYRLVTQIGEVSSSVDIAIRPKKISEESYERLIDDLETNLPASIAIGLQNGGALAGVERLENRESTLEEQILRLRRAVLGSEGKSGLSQTLPRIAESPHSILISDYSWVKRDRVHRPAAHRFAQAFARPGNIDENGLPVQMIDSRVELSFDVYENRLLKFFLRRIEARLSSIVRLLGTKNKPNLLVDSEQILEQVRLARKSAPFLDQVQDVPNVSDSLSMVFLKHPLYRTVLDRYIEYKNSFRITLEQPALDAPLTNFPDLYQSWATMVVLDTLMTVAIEHGFRIESNNISKREFEDICIKIYPDGQQAIVLKHEATQTRISLTPEQSFASGDSTFHSVSFTQRPDISIRIDRPGLPTKIVLLDPKYKLDGEDEPDDESSNGPISAADQVTGKPKKIDIDKMHAYRDAIRTGDGERVVSFAGILYPGQSQTFSEDVQAIRAVPGEDQELRDRISELVLTQIA